MAGTIHLVLEITLPEWNLLAVATTRLESFILQSVSVFW
jgi:hypothetical protein